MTARVSPVRVLFVNSSARLYGADKSLLDIVATLDRTVFDPLVLVPEEGPLVVALERLAVKTICRPFPHAERRNFKPLPLFRFAVQLARSVAQTAKLIRDEKIALVHSNTSACLASAIAARLTGRPHVWHIRELCSTPRFVRLVYRIVIPLLADRAVAASTVVRENYSTAWNGLRRKFALLPHGVDNARFERGVDTIRKQFGIESHTRIVGNVGMLRPQKGQHLFLRVAQLVKADFPWVRFLICGDLFYDSGTVGKDLPQLCSSLGLSEDVTFTGFRSDVEDVYASFDVLAHTSFGDSYGRTILEAMAAGTPVVAFASGGTSELVRHGLTGYLVPFGNVRLMAEAIVDLLRDEGLRRNLGSEGRRIARECYSTTAHVEALETIYTELLEQSSEGVANT